MIVYRPLPCDKPSPCCSWVTIAMKRLWLKSRLLFTPRSGALPQSHLGTEYHTGLSSACCWCLYFTLSVMYVLSLWLVGDCSVCHLTWPRWSFPNLPMACSLLHTQIGKEESIQCWEAALWGSWEVSLWLSHCSIEKLCCALSRNWQGSKDRLWCMAIKIHLQWFGFPFQYKQLYVWRLHSCIQVWLCMLVAVPRLLSAVDFFWNWKTCECVLAQTKDLQIGTVDNRVIWNRSFKPSRSVIPRVITWH